MADCLHARNELPGVRRWGLWPIGLAVCVLLVLYGPAGPSRSQGQPADRFGAAAEEEGTVPPGEQNGNSERRELLREGTQLSDTLGHFKLSGSRVVFVLADGSRQLTVLENLNLERVTQMARDDGQRVSWTVSGLVTEYQGTNYLLVNRARRRSSPARRPAAEAEADGAAPRGLGVRGGPAQPLTGGASGGAEER